MTPDALDDTRRALDDQIKAWHEAFSDLSIASIKTVVYNQRFALGKAKLRDEAAAENTTVAALTEQRYAENARTRQHEDEQRRAAEEEYAMKKAAANETVRLADAAAADVERRRREQYAEGTLPAPVYETGVFVRGPFFHSAANVKAKHPVMRFDEPPLQRNVALTAAVELVVARATLELCKVDRVLGEYTDHLRLTRSQIFGADPSGSTLKAGGIHPQGGVLCAVMPQRGNPKCHCGRANAAECNCPPGHPQKALMWLHGASSSDAIVPVKDAALRRAVTVVGQELGLTSTFLGH